MTVMAEAEGHGPGCELPSAGLLAEPVAAISSLAFVVAGAVIAARYLYATRGRQADDATARGETGRAARLSALGYPTLVAAVGVGSLIQHGPNPAYSDLAHDLPLLATLAFVAADSSAALSGRMRVWWWAVPTLVLVPLILAAPRAGDLAQLGVAVVAVSATLLRAYAHPPVRGAVLRAGALLAAGGLIGTLSRAGGPLCDPESLWQGHAVWHVLAAAALVVLAPIIGRREVTAQAYETPGRRRFSAWRG